MREGLLFISHIKIYANLAFNHFLQKIQCNPLVPKMIFVLNSLELCK